MYFLCLVFCCKWKAAKWIEIRMMTAYLKENASDTERFNEYFKEREIRDKDQTKKASYMREKLNLSKIQKSMKK
jgi:hypothetical protein